LNPSAVNIIRPGALGDTIVSLPVAAMIKGSFPAASITWIGGSSACELRDALVHIDRALMFSSRDLLPLFAPYPLPHDGRCAELDIPKEGLLRDILCADVTIAFMKNSGQFERNWDRLGGGRLVVAAPEPIGKEPTSAGRFLCRQAASALGIQPAENCAAEMSVPDWARAKADSWLKKRFGKAHSPLLAVHVGSGSRRKCWPSERFAELLDEVGRDSALLPVLLEGPADRPYVQELLSKLKCRPPLFSNMSLPVVAAMLQRSKLYLGSDSGISHLAAAAGVTSIVIFGPTDAEFWGPTGKHVHIVTAGADCSPCTRERADACNSRRCLKDITAPFVLRLICKLRESA